MAFPGPQGPCRSPRPHTEHRTDPAIAQSGMSRPDRARGRLSGVVRSRYAQLNNPTIAPAGLPSTPGRPALRDTESAAAMHDPSVSRASPPTADRPTHPRTAPHCAAHPRTAPHCAAHPEPPDIAPHRRPPDDRAAHRRPPAIAPPIADRPTIAPPTTDAPPSRGPPATARRDRLPNPRSTKLGAAYHEAPRRQTDRQRGGHRARRGRDARARNAAQRRATASRRRLARRSNMAPEADDLEQPSERRRAALGAARALREEPAATYSPRPVKAKYHRRCGA